MSVSMDSAHQEKTAVLSTRTNEVPGAASVLIAEDEPSILRLLAFSLSRAGYTVTTAKDGQEALEKLMESRFDALLTDVEMPRLAGDELQRKARALDPDMVILMLTAMRDADLAVECLKDGVFDYMTKPFKPEDVLLRVSAALEARHLRRENRDIRADLEEQARKQAEQTRRVARGAIEALLATLESRTPGAKIHALRVASLSSALAWRLWPGDVPFASRVLTAGLLHDVGDLALPENILAKPGALTEEERAQVRRSPYFGDSLLAGLLDDDTRFMVRAHRERRDGSGSPDGLHSDAIPLGSSIVGLAEAFDAMTSTRPWRPALPLRQTLEEMHAHGCGLWDAAAVEALIAQVAAPGGLSAPDPEALLERAAATVAGTGASSLPLPVGVSALPVLSPPGTAAEAPAATEAVRPTHVPPLLPVRGSMDEDTVYSLRTQMDRLLRRGEREIAVDLCEADHMTAGAAQGLYALHLQARRAGSRLVLRDAPHVVTTVLRDIGLARMLYFEHSDRN